MRTYQLNPLDSCSPQSQCSSRRLRHSRHSARIWTVLVPLHHESGPLAVLRMRVCPVTSSALLTHKADGFFSLDRHRQLGRRQVDRPRLWQPLPERTGPARRLDRRLGRSRLRTRAQPGLHAPPFESLPRAEPRSRIVAHGGGGPCPEGGAEARADQRLGKDEWGHALAGFG